MLPINLQLKEQVTKYNEKESELPKRIRKTNGYKYPQVKIGFVTVLRNEANGTTKANRFNVMTGKHFFFGYLSCAVQALVELERNATAGKKKRNRY